MEGDLFLEKFKKLEDSSKGVEKVEKKRIIMMKI